METVDFDTLLGQIIIIFEYIPSCYFEFGANVIHNQVGKNPLTVRKMLGFLVVDGKFRMLEKILNFSWLEIWGQVYETRHGDHTCNLSSQETEARGWATSWKSAWSTWWASSKPELHSVILSQNKTELNSNGNGIELKRKVIWIKSMSQFRLAT